MNKRLYDVLKGTPDNHMLPFYWQHGDHRATIPQEVERIYKSGCRAFCVESRPHHDFCGDDWWADMDIILKEAKDRDMKVWILDDDHFPTGHAVGKIEKEYPHLRGRQVSERHVDVMGPKKNAMLNFVLQDEDDILLGVYAYKRIGLEETCVPEPIDLTAGYQGKFLHFDLPEGCYRIFFIFSTYRGNSRRNYIDMLRYESVKVLLDTVYEAHYEHYKEEFGKTIAGFFSDEPAFGNDFEAPHYGDPGMYHKGVGTPGLAMPWNDALLCEMDEVLGFDAKSLLPALWFDFGEKGGMLRHAYMDAITKRYRDCFTRQLGDWCEAHGVDYIGHIIEDMNAHARTSCSAGHYFRSLDGQHMSGMDIVLHQLMPGMGDYIHTMSGCGNNSNPAFFDYVLSKLTSSLAHIGIQMNGRAMCEVFGAYGWAEGSPEMKWLLDHLLVRGVNYFVPHAFSPLFPDPDCPPHFGADGKDPQYEGFSKLMDYGNKAAHLISGGVMQTDAAILYHADTEWMNLSGDAMLDQVPAKVLYDAHIDYDILPADCFVDGSGSRVYPAKVEDGMLAVGKQRYRYLVLPAAKAYPKPLEDAIAAIEQAGVPVIRMAKDWSGEQLLSAIKELSLPQDIKVPGNPFLRCCHYKDGAADIYMFVNESVCDAVDTVAALNGIGDAKGLQLDILNDEVGSVAVKDGKLSLKLAPYQSVFVVLEEGIADEYPELKEYDDVGEAQFNFKVELASHDNMELYRAYKEEVASDALVPISEELPEFSGQVRYTAVFDHLDADALDLGEVGVTSHLWLNGEDLGVRVCPPYRYNISNQLKESGNELVIEVSNTLANAVQDFFSTWMTLQGTGLGGGMRRLKIK